MTKEQKAPGGRPPRRRNTRRRALAADTRVARENRSALREASHRMPRTVSAKPRSTRAAEARAVQVPPKNLDARDAAARRADDVAGAGASRRDAVIHPLAEPQAPPQNAEPDGH